MARPRSFDEAQVLRTARERFSSTGYAATSIDEVAAATGLGKGSLYGAFGDKHHLFLRVFEGYCADISEQVEQALAGPDAEAFERLSAHLRAVAANTAADVEHRGCLLARAPRNSPARTRPWPQVPCASSNSSKTSSRRVWKRRSCTVTSTRGPTRARWPDCCWRSCVGSRRWARPGKSEASLRSIARPRWPFSHARRRRQLPGRRQSRTLPLKRCHETEIDLG